MANCWRLVRWGSVLVLLTGFLVNNMALAQELVVQVLNGRSGRPMTKIRVYIPIDDHTGHHHLFDLLTNQRGEVRFESSGARSFQVRPVGQIACGEQPVGAPYRDYSVAETLQTGLLTKNTCGTVNIPTSPGKLIYFVRPATWLELLRN